MTRNNHYADNVARRERIIVTVKPYQNDGEGRATYKIIGPKRADIEIRVSYKIDEKFLVPFRNGAKEIKCYAVLGRNGRWSLVDLVPHVGLEPTTFASTVQRSAN